MISWRKYTTILVFLAVLPACVPLAEVLAPSPAVPVEWSKLVDEVRAFERRIGFRATNNFRGFTQEHRSYAFCGYAPQLVLPYSYEDPAIHWIDANSLDECGRLAAGAEVYFGRVEALGENDNPVTASMISGRLERFLYVVIHEDCHDQFDFPYGIEEALCNVIAYRAMAAFTDERFGLAAREDRAVRRYVERESKRTLATKHYYEELELLHARHARMDVSDNGLIAERARLLARASSTLSWKGGAFNGVALASHMTYSRHYPFLASVLAGHGDDLALTVAFFMHVDRIKPSPAEVAERRGIASAKSVELLRAYEGAVIETIRRALATSAQ